MDLVPPWCRPPDPLLERDSLLDAAAAASEAGPVSLHGPAGVGATVAGAALVARLVRDGVVSRAVFLRADSCTVSDDLVRAVGVTLGVVLAADGAEVGAALRQAPTVLFVDDADLAADALTILRTIAPDARLIATGRGPLPDTTPLEVRPLSPDAMTTLLPPDTDPAPYLGLPLLAMLPAPPLPGRPWAATDTIPPGAEILAELPMGLPGFAIPLADALRVPHPDRTILRRSLREALGAGADPSSESIAAALRDRLEEAHRLATGVQPGAPPEDVAFYRTAARIVADPDLAAVGAAAAARLYLRWFQPEVALALVRTALADRPPAQTAALGMLRWLEGEALLDCGGSDDADETLRAAARAISEAGAKRALSALARRVADRFAARGEGHRARRWLTEARSAASSADDPLAWADSLRIAGDLAAQGGELVGAAALYEEAVAAIERVPGGQRERASVHLGQMALELASGQYAVVEDLLVRAEAAAGDDPLLIASIAWRRAELASRRGRHADARAAIAIAETGYASCGHLRGLALCARLSGDVAALAGDRRGAVAAYRHAASLYARQRDLAGLRRVLRRALAIEREGLPGPHVEEVQARLDLAEVLLRVR